MPGLEVKGFTGALIAALAIGVVILRRRSCNQLSGDVVHYWRYRDHDNAGCPARFAVRIRKANGGGHTGGSPRLATEA